LLYTLILYTNIEIYRCTYIVREITQGLIGRDKIIIHSIILVLLCIIVYLCTLYTGSLTWNYNNISYKGSIQGRMRKSVSRVGVVVCLNIKILNA